MKKVVQLNNFSFFSFSTDVTTTGGETASKVETEDLTYDHGSYVRECCNALLQERVLQVSFSIKKVNIPASYRTRLFNKMKRELTQSGTLWAVENDNLYYTRAVFDSISEEDIGDGVQFTLNLILPKPFWVIADPNRTLINTFDNVCGALMCEAEGNRLKCGRGCLNFKICVKDLSCGCCRACPEGQALCSFGKGEIECLFTDCFTFPLIAYDCNACGDYSGVKYGRKHGQDNITTTIESMTQFETPLNWAMIGHFKDVVFRVNHNTIKVNGEFKGTLEYKNGCVLYNGKKQKISVVSASLPNRRTHKIQPGKNSIQISNLRDWRFSIVFDWENRTL